MAAIHLVSNHEPALVHADFDHQEAEVPQRDYSPEQGAAFLRSVERGELVAQLVTTAIAPHLILQPREGEKPAVKSGIIQLSGSNAPTHQEFIDAVMDGDHYPLDATVNGVQVLQYSASFGTTPDGYTVVFQITGGVRAIVTPRVTLTALKASSKGGQAIVESWAIDFTFNTEEQTFTEGPYKDRMQTLFGQLKSQGRIKDMPYVQSGYSHVTWVYDGAITYSIKTDPGGSMPRWLVTEGAVLAVPRALVDKNWKK